MENTFIAFSLTMEVAIIAFRVGSNLQFGTPPLTVAEQRHTIRTQGRAGAVMKRWRLAGLDR
jgi:hypothetical protein